MTTCDDLAQHLWELLDTWPQAAKAVGADSCWEVYSYIYDLPKPTRFKLELR